MPDANLEVRSDANRELEGRVLLVPPTVRDGEITRGLLANVGLQCVVCSGLSELTREIEAGAAAPGRPA